MTVDTARVGTAWVAVGSTRGPLHHEFGTSRQDAYLVASTADERWVVVSVADGVSEAHRSHEAAEKACREATETVRDHLNNGGSPEDVDWNAVVRKCQDAIRRLSADRINSELAARVPQAELDHAIAKKVMSTTLQVGIVSSQAVDGARSYVVARLAGDGSAYNLSPANGWTTLIQGKDNGDGIQTNAVVALPRDPGPPGLLAGTLTQGEALVICTDGIGDELSDGSNELGDFLKVAWAEPVSAVEFLRTINFVKAGATDDRTAAVVWS